MRVRWLLILLPLILSACDGPASSSDEAPGDLSTQDAGDEVDDAQDAEHTPDDAQADDLDVDEEDDSQDADAVSDAGATDTIDTQEVEETPAAFECDDVLSGELDPYGGWLAVQWEATGFFRVDEVDGRWWLVTPDGHPFFSTGVNSVGPGGSAVGDTGERPYLSNVLAAHGDIETWVEVTIERLRAWGFNTLGAWSDDGRFSSRVPYTRKLNMSASDWLVGDVPDYWSTDFEAHVTAEAAELQALAGDPWFLGYFVDNEVRWGGDHRDTRTLFEEHLTLDAEAPGKIALVELMRARHGDDIASFNAAWGVELAGFDALGVLGELPAPSTSEAMADASAFLSALADRFFEVTAAAGRAAAPQHLNLGVRFVGVLTPREVVEACGRHADVCSVNHYKLTRAARDAAMHVSGALDPDPFLENYFEANGRPIIISEFGFRAEDSGLPNTWPPIYPIYESQEDRARGLADYALKSYQSRHVVGYHWFTYTDQPVEGRFDGENNNWGLVNIEDTPYGPVVDAAAWYHARMYPCIMKGATSDE